MFARVTASAHICFRCQIRLLNANSTQAAAFASTRRWQSSALARAEEEDDDEFDAPSETRPATPSKLNCNPKQKSTKRASPIFRKWRPSPTAQLGVNSLGKPAEVLILPARDRKIPRIPQEIDKEKKEEVTLQEALDAEKNPLDVASLHKNILQVRRKIDIDRGQLELKDYDTLKKSLSNGFTLEQLKHFLNAHKREDHPDGKHIKRSWTSKPRVIIEILNMWGYILPVDNIDKRKLKRSKIRRCTYSGLDRAEFEHMLTDRRQPLKQIAERFDVTIDVFRRQKQFRVSGPVDSAKKALQAIARIAREELESIDIPFSEDMSAYADSTMKDAVDSFLKHVEQKYFVHILRKKIKIKIVHRGQPQAAQQAARDIRLAGETRLENHKIYVWQSDGSSLQTFPTPPEFAWAISQKPWSRLMASTIQQSGPISPPNDEKSSSPDIIAQKIVHHFGNHSVLTAAASRNDLRFEVVAKFGQALFQEDQPALASLDPASSAKNNRKSMRLQDSDGPDTMEEFPLQEGVSVELSESSEQATKEDLLKQELLEGFSGPSKKDPHTQPRGKKKMQSLALEMETETEMPRHPGIAIEEVALEASGMSSTVEGPGENHDTDRQEPPFPLKNPAFTGNIPYSAQQIAGLKPWNFALDAKRDSDSQTRITLRVEFVPLPRQRTRPYPTPSFEVFLTLPGQNEDGLRRIEISRVSAIHREKSFYVLCPTHHADVKFIQQLKQDLQYPDGDILEFHKATCSAIHGYFINCHQLEANDWVFPPFLDIPLNFRMRNIAAGAEDAISRHGIYCEPERGTHLTRKGEKIPRQEIRNVPYMLRALEIIDVDSRTLPVTMAFRKSRTAILSLEHISLSGSNAARQELRLADRPLLMPPSAKQPDLAAFVKTALGLVKHLGKSPEVTTLSKIKLESDVDLQDSLSEFTTLKSLSPGMTTVKSSAERSGKHSEANSQAIATASALPMPKRVEKNLRRRGKSSPGSPKSHKKVPKEVFEADDVKVLDMSKDDTPIPRPPVGWKDEAYQRETSTAGESFPADSEISKTKKQSEE